MPSQHFPHELQFYFNGLGNLFSNRFSACQKGTFGPNCTSHCSDICPENTRCSASNEGCNAKCEPGFTGEHCDTGSINLVHINQDVSVCPYVWSLVSLSTNYPKITSLGPLNKFQPNIWKT